MNRPRIVYVAALALVAASCQQGASPDGDPAVTDDRLNILWLVAEDLSANELATHGNEASQTPNIDRLAGDGILFTHAFTTTPVCAPSRSSLITGMQNTTINAHNHRSHVGPKSPYQTDYTLPQPVQLLPKMLQDAGYTTAIWGKTDYNFNWEGAYDYQYEDSQDLYDWDEITSRQPFFAQVQFRETHRDWDGNERVIDRSAIRIPPIYPDTEEVREAWGLYLDDLASLDRKVGRVRARLEESGLADNTVIMFFSDHGREMPRGKQWVYDGGIHVPLVVYSPNGDASGSVSSDLVSLIDVSATTLDYAGVEIPDYFDGRSLIDPDVKARDHIIATRDRDDETFDRVRAVRTHRYKYIRNYYPELPWTQYNHYIEHLVDGRTHYETFGIMRDLHEIGELTDEQALFFAPEKPREELYDLANDPWETKNLASDPTMSKVLEELRTKLDDWIESPHPQLGWRDKGAVPEDGTRLFVISQNAVDRTLVDIVTTVDDIDGRECSLQVEFSTDNGATWAKAYLTDTSSADYGTVRIDNEAEYQVSKIQTDAAGANTIRFQWDTQRSARPLREPGYDQVLIRTTQWNGETARPPVVSTRGFVREFPAVVVDRTPLQISLE